MKFKVLSITEESITAMLFVVIVFGLGICTIPRWMISAKTITVEEKRLFAACPHLHWNFQSLVAFPAGFDAFYNDRFVLRQQLLATINLVKYNAFAYSENPNVLVGKNGWLFYTDGGDEETLRGWPPMTRARLDKLVRILEARRAWLAARNIRYLVFIPPSKCTIYREEVPAVFASRTQRSRLDNLMESLKANSQVECLDVRRSMTEAKRLVPLYFKTDSHWNQLGAFVAYLELTRSLRSWFPAMRPLCVSALNVGRFRFGHGDLSEMLGLYDLIPESGWRAVIVAPRAHLSDNPPPPDLREDAHAREPFATEIDDLNLPKAFCLRDSFAQSLHPYLSENFRRIVYHWRHDFPVVLIEQEHPDVVIQEFTERVLARDFPDNPPEVDQYAPGERFAARTHNEELASAKVTHTN